MTTVLSKKGQIVLPGPVRAQLRLEPGQDFEVYIDDDDSITLRLVSHPANYGLTNILLACPSPFEVPARETDDSNPLSL